MESWVQALGCVAIVIFALPVWAIFEARRARRDARAARAAAEELSARIRQLDDLVFELGRGAQGAARREPARETPAAARPAVPPPAPVRAPVPSVPTARPPAPVSMPLPSGLPSPPATDAAPPPAPPRPPRPALDWESLISVRAFAWLGGAALFLAAALFLQYSIQHGLIPPSARVAIGLLVGAAALAGGDWLRTRGDWAGQAISGAGVAILYASLYAAHARYALIGSPVTFAGMALVTVTAGVVAVRRNALAVAVLGLAGGFLTPYLLSTKEDHPLGLFAYALLLDVGILAVSRARRWTGVRMLGLVATAVLFSGWASLHLDAAKAPGALLAGAVLGALFALPRVVEAADRGRGELTRAIPILAILAPLLLATVISETRSLAVSPGFLAGYLLLLGAGAVVASRRIEFAPLVPIAAGLSVLTLTTRVARDVFPSRSTETLAWFLLVPAAYTANWALSRLRSEESALRAAAGIALAGGVAVLTAVLAITPRTQPVLPLWAFAAAHAAGLLVIAGALASGPWIAGSQLLLYASLLALGDHFTAARLSDLLPFIAAPALVYWALPFLSFRWRSDRVSWLSSAAAPLLHFAVLYALARTRWSSTALGGVAVVLAAAALFSLRRATAILTEERDRRFTAALFAAVTLAFVTAAVPILLEKQWITIAWALESAALAWLFRRLGEPGLVKVSAGLAAAAVLRLLANPALWGYHARSGMPVVNWYLYTFSVPAVAFLLAAGWVAADDWARRVRYPQALRIAAGVLLFVLVNVEIADFYSTGVSLTFRLSGGGLAEDMTYSLAWGAFAIGLLFLGLARSSKPARAAALLVLVLTIGKVFLHDLWDLGALYRVGSIVGLAVALLAVSYLTQRFVLSRGES
jgi:hypothetical protein